MMETETGALQGWENKKGRVGVLHLLGGTIRRDRIEKPGDRGLGFDREI